MKIIVAGTGFVGLTHAAVCSEYGHEVYAYDIDQKRLAAYRSAEREQIEHYVSEPGLTGIIAENLDRYLFFIDDLTPVIEGVDAIFLCLPTPPNRDGSSDLSYYFNAVNHIAGLLANRKDQRRVVLINKSITLLGGWDNAFSTQNATSVIDGQGARRGVTTTNTTAVIENFTIQNGFHVNQGGGIYNFNGTLTLNNSIVTRNVSEWMGGGKPPRQIGSGNAPLK